MWTPTSEAEIIAAIDDALLAESHVLEIKRGLPEAKGDRSEIARGLASMALDGGAFLFGVEELKDEHSFRSAPMELNGGVEALEQIAELRIEPPLTIRVQEIPSASDPSKGYLYVIVDASPLAPHMVDGVYYGRGEKRRRRLGDAEVVRLHRARVTAQESIREMLESDIQADPVPPALRRRGHLFVVATPVSASPSMAESWVWDRTPLFEMMTTANRVVPSAIAGWAPRPGMAHTLQARANGQAWTSVGTDEATHESTSVDLEFREDGSIHIFVGRLTDEIVDALTPHAVLDGLAVAYVMRAIGWAVDVAQRSGYTGSWYLGVAGTGLKGAVASSNTRNGLDYDGTVYSEERYMSTTQATRTEMMEQPGVVAGRLLGRFARSMKLGAHYGPLFGWAQ